ncbi:5'/3'-nucleotidase SurE, partial [Mesorhizobium sp. M7A.F.Ca.US.001.01.1.1]
VITVPRGRAHDSQPGDENDVIDAGFISINRLNWLGETRLDERFLDGIPRQRQTG